MMTRCILRVANINTLESLVKKNQTLIDNDATLAAQIQQVSDCLNKGNFDTDLINFYQPGQLKHYIDKVFAKLINGM